MRDEARLGPLQHKSRKKVAQSVALAVTAVPLAALGVWLLLRSRKAPAIAGQPAPGAPGQALPT